MKPRSRPLAAVTAVLVLLAPRPHAIAASDLEQDEAQLISMINTSRQAHRLPPLELSPELVDYARAHSRQMATRRRMFHSTAAQLRSLLAGGSGVGENVAFGSAIGEIHARLMKSSRHRANVLGPYAAAGIGVERGADGLLYVTEVFRR